nr:RNA-directed DNA polymerase, eukaryota, reverse transcriptase zinc-binding domain protein [Tanacetum cinerariifolium]
DDTVDRVRKRLSKWKMKTLSSGGRLTLVKSVLGSMLIFHMSLFKVPSGINLMNYLRITLGNGESTFLWDDPWHVEGILKDRYPRVYALETCKTVTVGGYPRAWVGSLDVDGEQFW